jgi:hypothetical protein
MMMSTNFFAGHNSQTSALTIDNVQLTGGVPQLPNSDMETWFTGKRNQAVSWWSPDDIMHWPFLDSSVVTKSTDAFNGNYALMLRNNTANGQYASIATGNTGVPRPNFSVSHLYKNLNGYLKFTQDNNDTLYINISMFNSGFLIGSGFSMVTATVPNYEAFEVPIIYTMGNLVPDSSQVSFQIWKDNGQTAPGASFALIDDLTFDGLIQTVPIENQFKNVAMNLFPNPVENYLSMLLKNFNLLQGKTAEIQIMDITGRIVKTEMVEAKELLQVDVSSLSPQLYFLKLSIEGKFIITKFIKN